MNKIINSYIEESKKALDTFLEIDKVSILNASKLIVKAFKSGNKVLMCGNGGSASDAQHFAAELIGRFKSNRPSFAAISLNTDTSALTAIANDYDFTNVFSRQVEGIGKKGDILFFGNKNKCDHVGIYKGDGLYYHSSGIDYGRNGIGIDTLKDTNDKISLHYQSKLISAGRIVRSYRWNKSIR